MNDLKNEYKSFLDDIEKNIKNKEDLEYIRIRFASFLDVVLDKLEYLNAIIYRTDLNGTIIVSSNGEEIEVTTKITDTNYEEK